MSDKICSPETLNGGTTCLVTPSKRYFELLHWSKSNTNLFKYFKKLVYVILNSLRCVNKLQLVYKIHFHSLKGEKKK